MKALQRNPLINMLSASWRYAAGHRRNYLIFMSLSAAGWLLGLFLPYLLGRAFNEIQLAGDGVVERVAFWMLLYLGVRLVFWSLHGPSRLIEKTVAFDVRRNFYDNNYDKLKSLPLMWHQNHHSGDTINRTRKAGQVLFEFTGNVHSVIYILVTILGPLTLLFFYAWPVALVAIALNVTVFLLIYRFDHRIIYWLNQQNERDHRFSSAFYDYVGNMKSIISLRLGNGTRAELMSRVDDIKPPFKKHILLDELKYFAMDIGSVVALVVVIVLYLWWQTHSTGMIMVGSTVAVMHYLQMINRGFYDFAGYYQGVLGCHTDYCAFAPIDEATAKRQLPAQPLSSKPWQQIEINRLSFAYELSNGAVLDDVSFSIRRGEKIALVGHSGSGKSTLLGILRGLLTADTCECHVDSSQQPNLNAISQTSTLIPQDPEIFENTIAFNISVGMAQDPTLFSLATHTACFDKVAQNLAQGYDTDIRERGVNLSGGEKQRLALARGLYAAHASQVLLLDEPTSSVDAQIEQTIYRNLFRDFADKTIMSSFHRLHLAQQFDKILVFDHGSIVQTGTFDELVAQPGHFKDLWDTYQVEANSEQP